jgi:hypothetical protein
MWRRTACTVPDKMKNAYESSHQRIMGRARQELQLHVLLQTLGKRDLQQNSVHPPLQHAKQYRLLQQR